MSTWREEYQGDAESRTAAVRSAGAGHDAGPAQDQRRAARPPASSARFTARRVFAAVDGDAELRRRSARGSQRRLCAPGKSYPTIVRLSNASGSGQPDYKPDLRGVALRIKVSDGEQHDLLATNFPVSHARRRKAVRRVRQGDRRRNAEPARRHHRPGRSRSGRPRRSACCATSRPGAAARSAAWRWKPSGAAAPSAGARRSRCAIWCARRRVQRPRRSLPQTDPEYLVERIRAPPRCRRDPLRALHPALCRCDDRRRSRIRRSNGPSAPRRR